MKILHTSDWHIGHTLYAKKRHGEHEFFLLWLTKQIRQRKIDALIVSGDIFDTGVPGGQAQKLYYDFLKSILGTNCRTVVIVAGNHDSPSMLEAPSAVLESLNIHIIGLVREIKRHVIPLCDGNGETKAICCAVPYLRKNEMVKMQDDDISSDEKIVRATARLYSDVTEEAISIREETGTDLPIIATGHLFAQGAQTREGDGVRDLYVGNLGQVGADIFPKAIDYVALGHIHSEQSVMGNENIRYCGSPLHMSFSEIGKKKYVLEIDTKNGINIDKIEVPVFQQMKAITGEYQEIIKEIKEIADEDIWIEVTYTGKEIIPGLSADIQAIVKNAKAEVLSIRNNAAISSILAAAAESETLETMKVQDVFLKCFDSNEFADKHRQELIDCFNEIVAELEEAE